MIKAYNAGYIKYDTDSKKRPGPYLILEMSVATLDYVQLIVIQSEGLVCAHRLRSVTEIANYHRYNNLRGIHLGAGDLLTLTTKGDAGMLVLLARQMNLPYPMIASAFGEGLIRLSNIDE